jgi:2-(1,2-epoxy-1,2-dihydrophenyl)acetyl-CoA isomerase
MDFEHILYDTDDAVATITLNRPERLNALVPLMRQELLQAIEKANRDEGVRAVILTGAGRGFCSGLDMKASADRPRNDLSEAVAPIRDKVMLGIRNSDKPYIAGVNGAAAGGGMGIALACDIRIGATTARFGQTFAKRGLHPDWGGTYYLPRIVGMARACELIWSGRIIDAEEARALGIISELVEQDELTSACQTMARSFAEGPPLAIALSKRALYRNQEASLREALEFETYAQNICSRTDDAKEGINAFLEKRTPEFKGR